MNDKKAILLTSNDIIKIHDSIISISKGMTGIKNKGQLEASVDNTYETFFGTNIYPTIKEKAARLCFSIIKNHCFNDANKRTGFLIMIITLKINNENIFFTNEEALLFVSNVATDSIEYEDILRWIEEKIH